MEQDQRGDPRDLRPVNTNTFAIPNDKGLLAAYKVYTPDIDALVIKSEQNRSVFAEAFIEDRNLGTLSDLCVRAIAQTFGAAAEPFLANNPLNVRVQYDSISVDHPLEHLIEIEDKEFWKRLVLAKTEDKSMQFRDDTDWKALGISLKYVELVEKCPAEYWPEQKMQDLALKIKDYVTEMHIRKLQSMEDDSFARYLLRDSDTDRSDSTDVSSSSEEEMIAGHAEEFDEEEGMEEQEVYADKRAAASADRESEILSAGSGVEMRPVDHAQLDWDEYELGRVAERQKAIEDRREARRIRREQQAQRREKREAKRLLREELANTPKPKQIKVKNVFDIPVEEEEDEDLRKVDPRNKEMFLAQKKRYNYPPKHCHHIDLRFVRFFDKLVEFSIQFHPPLLGDKYHIRHFNFSYDDIEHLASGISTLETLRIFRLRNSRMDERKLRMLTQTLMQLYVETVDFSNNELEDDCDYAIFDLFQGNTTLKSLELEGNHFNVNVLRKLAFALRRYEGTLEYLGLARNPISDEALHSLCKVLCHTQQVRHLNLTCVNLSEMSVLCCVVYDLLRSHSFLRKLELVGIPITAAAGEDIIKALQPNLYIEELDCRGCNLPFEIEYEIEVCLQRNRYLVENPYIGDPNQTEAEIQEFLARTQNPILLRATEEVGGKIACIENRPDIAERFSEASIVAEPTGSMESVDEEATFVEQQEDALSATLTFPFLSATSEPFIYNPNEFNVEQFHAQVIVPGPGERYFYFKLRRERYMCTRND